MRLYFIYFRKIKPSIIYDFNHTICWRKLWL